MTRVNGGFTLLEVMIAIAIFALIGIASNSILTSVLNSNNISTERFDQLGKLQRAMLTLERDILQAVPRPVRIDGETNSIVISGGADLFDSEADGLGFVHGGWHNPQLVLPRSTLQAVAYRLQEGQLQKLYGNYVDNSIGHEPKVRVLLDNIEDFKVEFMAESGSDPDESSSWSETYTNESLPVALAIEINSTDFGVIRRQFLLTSQGS